MFWAVSELAPLQTTKIAAISEKLNSLAEGEHVRKPVRGFQEHVWKSPWGRVSGRGLCVYVCVAEGVCVCVCGRRTREIITQNEAKYAPIKLSCCSSQQPQQAQCHPRTARNLASAGC